MTCLCGSEIVPARRYEKTRTVDVWWCLDGCGNEAPPLYARTACQRNGRDRSIYPDARRSARIRSAIERRTA